MVLLYHRDMSGSDLHDPKAHAASHATSGSDALTPASIGAADLSDLALKADLVGGKVPLSQLPTISGLELGETSTTAYRGDRGKIGYDHSNMTSGTNPHNVTASNIGLGNCNNTSDADKPVSTVTQNALNAKVNISRIPANAYAADTIRHYKFDGDANDYSGGGYHGTAVNGSPGFVWEPFFGRQVANFYNTNYITASDVGLPAGGAAGTIMAWVFCAAVSRVIVGYGSTDTTFKQRVLAPSSSYAMLVTYYGSVIESSAYLLDHQWAHVASVFNGVTGLVYVNGILQKSSTTGAVNTVLNGTLVIGAQPVALNTPFIGKIADLRMMNRALTAGEIYAAATFQA